MKPLHDIRVIAIEQYGAGPFGSLQLADLGADVIKIEEPTSGGDVSRYVPPLQQEEDSVFFQTFNRNKRSISLDIRTPGGREVFEDLVRVSDAVISNLRGDVPAKLRIRYRDLAKVNPEIVCVSLSGFGQTGPRSKQPGYDYLHQALAGWMALTGEPDAPPTKSGLSLVDYSGGLFASIALLSGIHAARRDGKGMDFDLALQDVALSMLTYPATWYLNGDIQPERLSRSAHPSLVPFQLFQGSDGAWFVVACAKEKFWHRVAETIGRPDLIEDPRFDDFSARRHNRDELIGILDDLFALRAATDWVEALEAAGVPTAPVLTVSEALAEPHVAARGLLVDVEHETLGTVRQVGSPLRSGASDYRRAQRAARTSRRSWRGYSPTTGIGSTSCDEEERLAEMTGFGDIRRRASHSGLVPIPEWALRSSDREEQSSAPDGIEIEIDRPCVTRDGTILRADVYHPVGSGTYPTLVCRTPYDKSLPLYADQGRSLAEAGYCVVIQDMRGRHTSDGEFAWEFRPSSETDDAFDGYDTVEWAARLDWSDGRVGAFGHSYDAWAVWMMMSTQPPALRASFVSGMTQTLRAMTFGIFETGRRLEWTYTMAATDRRDGSNITTLSKPEATRRWHEVERGKYLWWLPLDGIPPEVFGHLSDQLREYLRSAHVDAWDFGDIHPRVSVPVMQMTGWWDRLIGTVDNYEGLIRSGRPELRSHHRLMIGPWGHDPRDLTGRLGPVDYGRDADRTYSGLVQRWFDFQLKGVDDGIGSEHPVQMFVIGDDRWRGEDFWPPREASDMALHLHSAGEANSVTGNGALSVAAPGSELPLDARTDLLVPPDCTGARSDSFVYDPRDPVMSLMRQDSQVVPIDQSPNDHREDVLVYQTSLLTDVFEVVGAPRLVLWAATDAPDTDWTAKLSQVLEDGTAINLTYGILRARYRTGYEQPVLLEPGEVIEYQLALNPIGVRLQPGERLRLSISSSDFPNFDRNHNTGAPFWSDSELRVARQTVFHSLSRPSRLILPVVLATGRDQVSGGRVRANRTQEEGTQT